MPHVPGDISSLVDYLRRAPASRVCADADLQRVDLAMVLGILALFGAIGTFAAAPMRYGENARLTRKERREKEAAARAAASVPTADTPIANLPPAPPLLPRERPTIAGRDASEV